MFNNLKKSWYDRKVYVLSYLYSVCQYRFKTENNIQKYAKQISKSVEYEKARYGRVLKYDGKSFDKDGIPFEGYAGVIRNDWSEVLSKKDE